MDSFQKRLSQFHIDINDVQMQQFEDYYNLLVSWNEKFNLTAITEREDVYLKHFVDSAALLKYQNLSGKNLIDVGTGAGFPGIVLKILCPECSVVLMDSLGKRVTFLNEVISSLGLTNIDAVHARAEDLARDDDYREMFSYGVSRAVANLSVLSEYCLPFVKVGGLFCSYKGDHAADEIASAKNAVNTLGGKIQSVEEYLLPDTDMNRCIITIVKNRQTSGKYPRKAGTPAKQPL